MLFGLFKGKRHLAAGRQIKNSELPVITYSNKSFIFLTGEKPVHLKLTQQIKGWLILLPF